MSYAAETRAAGPEQNWLPLCDSTYLDDAAAGALPATIAGHSQALLERLELHPVLASRADDPLPTGAEVIYLAAGCFWGVERIFWNQPGVLATAVGYMGGGNHNPTYREVCTGQTGHAETVAVVYDPAVAGVGGQNLLRVFFENHDSTQANRHGNDVGTQYRSAIWVTTPQQAQAAAALRQAFQSELDKLGDGRVCQTTIGDAAALESGQGGPFYLAEEYHQAYLHKNPGGYCNHGPNGIVCPVGIANLPAQTDVLPPELT